MQIFSHLPDEIIHDILGYDSRFIWREKRWQNISRFSKTDERYLLLEKIPRKWNFSDNSWSVILSFGNKKRFILGYRYITNNEWRYFFSVFLFDPFIKEIKEYPELKMNYILL